jgi:hypothetical protein
VSRKCGQRIRIREDERQRVFAWFESGPTHFCDEQLVSRKSGQRIRTLRERRSKRSERAFLGPVRIRSHALLRRTTRESQIRPVAVRRPTLYSELIMIPLHLYTTRPHSGIWHHYGATSPLPPHPPLYYLFAVHSSTLPRVSIAVEWNKQRQCYSSPASIRARSLTAAASTAVGSPS